MLMHPLRHVVSEFEPVMAGKGRGKAGEHVGLDAVQPARAGAVEDECLDPLDHDAAAKLGRRSAADLGRHRPDRHAERIESPVARKSVAKIVPTSPKPIRANRNVMRPPQQDRRPAPQKRRAPPSSTPINVEIDLL
jgi:hypothetical protein